ncbi:MULTISPECIES: restriction endonuclease subunit S [Pseudoalteromonas]|uniref:Type I restriction enzyme, S subunit n=1 Tax=Pseudoalteromonas aliena SW19 TaxID=1314866 RepID=A0ABR9E2I1_9GAMM|nr:MULTISPECIES: restriction endonuclease subunit S [Pseudoalteromonas]MBE0360145.1 type I restriction enzyme, S subunit [Pseudoalteromonas aliena SW19]
MSKLKAGKYQAYPEYKDSGVEWLGNIPLHWRIFDGKRIFNTVRVKALETDEQLAASQKYGVIPQSIMMKLNDSKVMLALKGTDSFRHVAKDNFVISLRSFEGGIEHSNYEGCVSPAYTVLEAVKSIEPRYYRYLLKSDPYIASLQASTDSLRDGKSISYEQFGSIPLPLDDIQEQTQIANFLDHETAKIDTLIEKQQQLIKLLKEKRQAVICHAVTKGLNPQAPMKDSDVAWLGEVPEHWGMIKLKHITHQIIDAEHKTAPYYDDGEYLVCRTTNVKDGKLRLEGGKYTNNSTYEEWTKRGLPEVGDILFTREAPAGEACVYTGEVPLCLGQRMVLFKLDQTRVSPDFVLHSIYSGLADDFVKQLSQGSTVAHFNMADIKNIPLFEPPIDEQVKIVEYLSMVLAKYDSLTSSVFRAIELMQERRTALISAAVTGKIDVRHWEQPND